MKIVPILLCLIVGCATMRESARLRQLHADLDDGRGRWTMEQMATAWGPPDKRDTIGASEFWTYFESLGGRAKGVVVTNGGQAVYSGTVSDRYEKVIFEFRDGIFVHWRADIRY